MSQVIEAIYEKGVLKPLTKINFKEHQKVKLTIPNKQSITALTKGMFRINPKYTRQIAENDSLSEINL